MAVQPIPAGYEGATPYLIVRDAAGALAYYRDAFGAAEVMRMAGPDGKIHHAEFRVGKANIMLADEHPEMGYASPDTYGGTPVSLMLYVPDVDAFFDRAVAAGGTAQRPVENQFYGDRAGTLRDPFGHTWTIATHVEDIAPPEMERRAAKAMQGEAG